MDKHLTDTMIDDYIFSPTKKIKNKVESHIQNCESCKEKIELAQMTLHDPEIEIEAAKTITDEDVEKIVKKLEPTYHWQIRKDAFMKKCLIQLNSIYILMLDFFSRMFQFLYALLFPPIPQPVPARVKRRTKQRFLDNAPVKRFGLGFLILRNEIICERSFLEIGLIIQFNRVRHGKVHMILELLDSSNRNVRASLFGSEIGQLSEIIDNKCFFYDLPFDTYNLTIRQFSKFKGKFVFSIRKEGIYEENSF